MREGRKKIGSGGDGEDDGGGGLSDRGMEGDRKRQGGRKGNEEGVIPGYGGNGDSGQVRSLLWTE